MVNILLIRFNIKHIDIIKSLSYLKGVNIYIYEVDFFNYCYQIGIKNIYNYSSLYENNQEYIPKIYEVPDQLFGKNSKIKLGKERQNFNDVVNYAFNEQIKEIDKFDYINDKLNFKLIVLCQEKESNLRALIYRAKYLNIYTLQLCHGFGEPVVKPQVGQYKHTIDCDGLAVWSEKVIKNTEIARIRNVDYFITGGVAEDKVGVFNKNSKNILLFTTYTFHDLNTLKENYELLIYLNKFLSDNLQYNILIKIHPNELNKFATIHGESVLNTLAQFKNTIFNGNEKRVKFVNDDDINYDDILIILTRPSSIIYELNSLKHKKLIIEFDKSYSMGNMYYPENNIYYSKTSSILGVLNKLIRGNVLIRNNTNFSKNRPYSLKETVINITNLILTKLKNNHAQNTMKNINYIDIVMPIKYEDLNLAIASINSIIYNIKNLKRINILAENNKVKTVLEKYAFKEFQDVKIKILGNRLFTDYYDSAIFYVLQNYLSRKLLYIKPGVVFNNKIEIPINNFSHALCGIPDMFVAELLKDNDLQNFNLNKTDKLLNQSIYFINTDFFKANDYQKHLGMLRDYLYKHLTSIKRVSPLILTILFRNVISYFDLKFNLTDISFSISKNISKENIFNIISEGNFDHPIVKRWHIEDYNPIYKYVMQNVSENVILTTYFTSKDNPQKDYLSIAADKNSVVDNVKPNDPLIVKPLFDSIQRLNINLVVFHDELTESFTKKYPDITFIKVGHLKSNAIDARWELYLNFVLNNKITSAFMVDCFDVKVVKNPFLLFDIFGDRLFVGRDIANSIGLLEWNINRLPRISNYAFHLDAEPNYERLLNSPFYNAGLLGGKRDILIKTLRFMVNIIDKVKCEDFCDMEVLNYTLFRLYSEPNNYRQNKSERLNTNNDLDALNETVFTGYPFNSAFKQFEENSDVCFIHK